MEESRAVSSMAACGRGPQEEVLDFNGGKTAVVQRSAVQFAQRCGPRSRGLLLRTSLKRATVAVLLALALRSSSNAFHNSSSSASPSEGLPRPSLRGGCGMKLGSQASNLLAGRGVECSSQRSLSCWRQQEENKGDVRGAVKPSPSPGTAEAREVSKFVDSSPPPARRSSRHSLKATPNTVDVKEEHKVDIEDKAGVVDPPAKKVDEQVVPLEASGAGDLVEPALEQIRSELEAKVPGMSAATRGLQRVTESQQSKEEQELPTKGPEDGKGEGPFTLFLVAATAALATAILILATTGRLLETLPGRPPQQPESLARQLAPRASTGELLATVSEQTEPAREPLSSSSAMAQVQQSAKLKDLIASDAQEASFARWYARATEAAKEATARITSSLGQVGGENGTPEKNGVPLSVVNKLRSIGDMLDDAQQDIYDETWVSLSTYPDMLRAFKPLFEFYNVNGLPYGKLADEDSNEAVRGALVYESGHLFTAANDFEDAVKIRKIRMVEKAFAEISLAYDRYLKAGNLYAGYDPVTSTTIFYQGIDDKRLVYTPLALDQPRIRDEVLVMRGPDKGKVGKVIWLGRDTDGQVLTTVVKLDPNPVLGNSDKNRKGVREVKAYPYDWIALTRSERQSYLRDLVLATTAAVVSCAAAYPLDTIKSRLQSNLPPMPPGGPGDLYQGLLFNLGREAPNAGFLMAGFNFLTRQAVALPFIDANNPDIKFLVMIPVGIIANASGIFIRTPFELLNKQIQTGQAKTDEEAWRNVFLSRPPGEVWNTLVFTGSLVLVRGVPFGALQCTFYEVFKERLPLADYDLPLSLEPLVWGALAGFLTGLLTNPPDVILTRAASNLKDSSDGLGNFFGKVQDAVSKINEEEGPGGFLKGGLARAAYFAPEAMIWFATYEYLKSVLPDSFT